VLIFIATNVILIFIVVKDCYWALQGVDFRIRLGG